MINPNRCGHCKAMARDWDALGNDFVDSSSVLIAEVDCTKVIKKTGISPHGASLTFVLAQSASLCKKYGVNGYPTMKYFTAGESAPKEYNGGRRFDVLKKFAEVRPARFTRHAVILLSPPSFQRSDPRLAWHRAPCRAKPATQPPLPPPRRCQSSLDAPPAPHALRQSEARLPAPLQAAPSRASPAALRAAPRGLIAPPPSA